MEEHEAMSLGGPEVPLVTVAVPTLNQGDYLNDALESIFSQDIPLEVYLADGGSTDGSMEVIRHWEGRLAGWRSHPDGGQAAAVNECIARGTAKYVAWLNSDDVYLPRSVAGLVAALESHPEWPMAYGLVWNTDAKLMRTSRVWTPRFSERWLANFCIISQPATLIRRTVWEAVGGLDESLHMAMDYDLWWRIYSAFGAPGFVDEEIALNRNHGLTKTRTRRKQHYQEAMAVVRKHYGRVPIKWWLAWPVSVWLRSCLAPQS